jgi:hypothetical protein
MEDTLPGNHFTVQDVQGDNACFFRSVANQLYFNSRYKKARIIYSKNNRIGRKSIDEALNSILWGFNGKEQTRMAKLLQQAARKILYKNRDKTVSQLDIKVSDFVSMTHELHEMREFFPGWEDIDIYNEIYKTFASERIFIKTDNGLEAIQERWGGASEQWALSHFLKMPITVYHLQGINGPGKMRNMKPTKKSYFKRYQTFGQKYEDITPTLNILFRNSHYLTLFEND